MRLWQSDALTTRPTNHYDCAGPGHDAPWDDATAGNDDAAAGHDATGHDDGRRNGATREEDL